MKTKSEHFSHCNSKYLTLFLHQKISNYLTINKTSLKRTAQGLGLPITTWHILLSYELCISTRTICSLHQSSEWRCSILQSGRLHKRQPVVTSRILGFTWYNGLKLKYNLVSGNKKSGAFSFDWFRITFWTECRE